MDRKIRILIVDDHPLMRSGISVEINAEPDMEVVAAAEDGLEALELFRRHRPEVSLIDLRMPKMNGLDLITTIRADCPVAKMIVLTSSAGDVHALRALRAGAVGYLLKHMLRDELISTIRDVHNGKRRIPDDIAQLVAKNAIEGQMTPREIEVLNQVAKGHSNKQISAFLFISEYTVKDHIKTILAKLGAQDRTHAVAIAVQRGFIDL
ncbi:response regulator [Silvibacterium sp.]|uniref:response regulator n=1 Tax=Silvibacterium sp. TaxID=1964179 RepID=UPI0039E718EE